MHIRSLGSFGLVVSLVAAGCASTVSPTPSPFASPPSASVVPSSTEPSPIASAVVSAAPASVAPSPVLTGWHLVALPDQAGISNVADLAASSDRILAVGGLAPTGVAHAWSSGDGGASWNGETIPADSRSPIRAVAWGARFLVVGAGEFNCAHPFALQSWVRVVDATWAEAPADPKFCVGGSAEVAVHDQIAVMAGTGSGDVPFVWSSPDGLHWIDRSSAVRRDTAPGFVIADGSGFTVFGSSPAGPWDAHSADGSAWQGERLPGNATVSPVGAFLHGSQPAVIVESGSSVAVVTRDSAGAWQTKPSNGLDASLLARVVAVNGGLVALGGGDVGPTIWASADGTSWRAVDLPSGVAPQTSLTAAIVANDRAVLSGQTMINGNVVGAIWIGPASLLAP